VTARVALGRLAVIPLHSGDTPECSDRVLAYPELY